MVKDQRSGQTDENKKERDDYMIRLQQPLYIHEYKQMTYARRNGQTDRTPSIG